MDRLLVLDFFGRGEEDDERRRGDGEGGGVGRNSIGRLGYLLKKGMGFTMGELTRRRMRITNEGTIVYLSPIIAVLTLGIPKITSNIIFSKTTKQHSKTTEIR